MNYDEIRNIITSPFDEDVFESHSSYFVNPISAYIRDQLAKQYFSRLHERYSYPPKDHPEKFYLLQNFWDDYSVELYDVFVDKDRDNFNFLSICLKQTGWKIQRFCIDSIRAEYTGDYDKDADEKNLDEKKIKEIIKRREGDFALEFTSAFMSEINLKYADVCVFTNEKLYKYMEVECKYCEVIRSNLAEESKKINSIFRNMWPLLRYWSKGKGYYQNRCYISHVVGTDEKSEDFCSFSHLNPNFIVQIFVLDKLLDEILVKIENIILCEGLV